MPDLFTVRAPLMIRRGDGRVEVMVELFPHPEGLVYFRTGCYLGQPDESTHVIRGEPKGEGPWKIVDNVIKVLGCHGVNSQPALEDEQWQAHLQMVGADYPAPALIAALALRYGAITE